MTSYKITWIAKSALNTKLQSDTIFGHICWAVRYLSSESKLKEILITLENEPRLKLSSGFPKNKLPAPALQLSTANLQNLKKELISDKKITELEWYQENKKIKKIEFIDRDLVNSENAEYSLVSEIRKFWNRYLEKKNQTDRESAEKDLEDELLFHNSINRETSTTTKGSGNLYTETVTYTKNDYTYESYLYTDLLNEKELELIFDYISQTGFGKNKNTGRGKFEIKTEKFEWKTTKNPNSYMSLSNMIPAPEDPRLYGGETLTKFGKLGGNFCIAYSPFKYPIIMYTPGSIFAGGNGLAEPKGSLLKNIHPDLKNIVQNLYAYCIPIKLKEAI